MPSQTEVEHAIAERMVKSLRLDDVAPKEIDPRSQGRVWMVFMLGFNCLALT